MTRRTKIVATLGPASDSDEMLAALMLAGVDVVRLNLSHGTVDDHLDLLGRVRRIADHVGRQVGILVDLPGPKIRAGEFPEGGVVIEPGTTVAVAHGDRPSDATTVWVDHPLDGLEAGDRITIGDGAINLVVQSPGPLGWWCLVETGGRVQGRPGVHLPSERTNLESPTAADLVLAETFAAAGVDFVAVSFVRRGDDVRRIAGVVAGRAAIVAKIETRAATAALDEILEIADVVMVARGDLGIDCPLEDVPHLQKRIIRRCVELGVPVITATQMLESMHTNPEPTRAEVSDVANAVFDGTDALMLSGETAIGSHPVLTVRTMASIAVRAEEEVAARPWTERMGEVSPGSPDAITSAITHAAAAAAVDVDASAILCATMTGRTARAMARRRPRARIVGLSPSPETVRRLTVSWGVDPVTVDTYSSIDELVWFAVERALQLGRVAHGDMVAVVAGAPGRGSGAAADVLRIVRVA